MLVADFGIARAAAAAGRREADRDRALAGHAGLHEPGAGRRGRRLDGRSDLYALGCVLYEMLAGQPPFTGPTAQAILARHAIDPVPSLRTVRSTVPLAPGPRHQHRPGQGAGRPVRHRGRIRSRHCRQTEPPRLARWSRRQPAAPPYAEPRYRWRPRSCSELEPV